MTKNSQNFTIASRLSYTHIHVERFLRKSFYVCRKIHVARLLQVDRIIGFYQKTEFCGLHFSKNFQIFIEVRRFVLIHLVPQAQLILRQLIRSKNLDFSFVTAGPLTFDCLLGWRSYSLVEINSSQDILAQDAFIKWCWYLFQKNAHQFNALMYRGDTFMP